MNGCQVMKSKSHTDFQHWNCNCYLNPLFTQSLYHCWSFGDINQPKLIPLLLRLPGKIYFLHSAPIPAATFMPKLSRLSTYIELLIFYINRGHRIMQRAAKPFPVHDECRLKAREGQKMAKIRRRLITIEITHFPINPFTICTFAHFNSC